MRPALFVSFIVPLLAACATFPELGDTPGPVATQAAYPVLLPIDTLLAQVPPAPPTDPGAAVAARAAALRARAATIGAAD